MEKTKYILYARKSTEDDDHQIMSIEAQLFELHEYAKREQIEIISEFIESKSAKKPGREKFGEMIELIEKSNGVGIISWHPDRLARNSVDGGKIIYLVDTQKIVSLRFPTFWFEPTPQGLFMLQVAFGQSKYYSDNLVENINRGIRQKVRRGEWLTKAPFGYVNNIKTRSIDPHPTLSRIIKKAFDEFATGKYTLQSLADLLAELGITTRFGTPLANASIHRMLRNQAYLGLVKHKGEYFEGSFTPLLDRATFEAAQEILRRKGRPRKSKIHHDFPFTGLMTCSECSSSITAQWVTNRRGKKYRYYRCTKKKGNGCSQKYIQEKDLAAQIRARLQSVALPDEWTDLMMNKVNTWEKEITHSSATVVQEQENKISDTQSKLDKLVSAYIDGDIPKDSYLVKKEELIKQKVTLANTDLGQQSQKWIEPLRQFILTTKKANIVASSDDYHEMKNILQKVGTNPLLTNRSISVSFLPPFQFLANRLSDSTPSIPFAPEARRTAERVSGGFFSMWTHGESNSDLIHAMDP